MSDSVFEATAYYGRSEAWAVTFDEGVIDLPQYPVDATIIVDWTAVDTSFGVLRSALGHLDTVLGSFSLRKVYPELDGGIASGLFSLSFNDTLLRNLHNIGRAFDTLPNVEGGPIASMKMMADVPNDPVSKLNQVVPHPVVNSAEISFVLRDAEDVQFSIVDMAGQPRYHAALGSLGAGKHTVMVPTIGWPGGTYLYTVTTPKGQKTKAFLLVRE